MNVQITDTVKCTDPASEKNLRGGEENKIYLFVCTGNTCRSPMAAAVANHLLRDRGITAISAGLSVPYPVPISRNAVLALEKKGIEPTEKSDYRRHLSQPLTAELLQKADRVYGLTENHSFIILTSFPEYSEKLSPLGVSVPDPYGGDEAVYEKALDAIIDAVKKL
ncbi:MAG: low molecular weight phosphatase family protein [Clostridia bacterium]|nr:low molecular weight phosphatase family protein [Clostridia bacterium]